MSAPTLINNQPISATFFNEGRWLTDFITPNALEVQKLHKDITGGIADPGERLTALWSWVANNVRYTRFVKGKIWVNGHSSVQDDYWATPSETARVTVGNCATKSFLLASLLRNELPAGKVHCVLGNLQQPKNKGGHAWVEVQPDGVKYIMESTRGDMKPMVLAESADIYEPVVYFNDEEVSAIEGRTVLEPFTAVYADWLRDYLDWAYIEGRK
jgi:hypothetical protein